MDERAAEIFNDSLERLLTRGGFWEEFASLFYAHFTSLVPEVAELFAETDWTAQKRMLVSAVNLILLLSRSVGKDDLPPIPERLERLAVRHGPGDLDIRPGLYDLWLDAFVETVAALDPDFSEEVGAAWRAALARGVAWMRSRGLGGEESAAD